MPRVAISLGASFLGYATHAGFLTRLHELGVRPVSVGGSSAGAIAAGLYAAGVPAEKIKEVVLSWAFRLSFIRKTPWLRHHLRSLFNEPNVSIFQPLAAVSYLESIVGELRIEDLKTPSFVAAVCDLNASKTLFLRKGELAKIMVASACVPALFAPQSFDGVFYHDGGIAHEAPIDPWIEDPEVDLIVMHRVCHPHYPFPHFFPFNVFRLTTLAHACAGEQLLEYRLKLAAMHGKKVLMTTTVHDRPALFSGKKMPDFYAAGVAQAELFYETELKALL